MNYPHIKEETSSAVEGIGESLHGSTHGCVQAGAFNGTGIKRRRTDEQQCDDIAMTSPVKMGNVIVGCQDNTRSNTQGITLKTLGRTFLHIHHSALVYHTEDWKPKGCTMYLPLAEDVMVNTRNIEQISFESDQFFLADEKGNYVGAKPGNAIHLWRFDVASRKLYISRSILFLKEQEYNDIRLQLETL